jgi:hypothetical protein
MKFNNFDYELAFLTFDLLILNLQNIYFNSF